MGNEFTAEDLNLFVAAALALLFLYVPGLKGRFDAMADNQKRVWMLVMLAVSTAVILGLNCAGVGGELFGKGVSCDRAGAISLLRSFGLAVVVNQGIHRIAWRPDEG